MINLPGARRVAATIEKILACGVEATTGVVGIVDRAHSKVLSFLSFEV